MHAWIPATHLIVGKVTPNHNPEDLDELVDKLRDSGAHTVEFEHLLASSRDSNSRDIPNGRFLLSRLAWHMWLSCIAANTWRGADCCGWFCIFAVVVVVVLEAVVVVYVGCFDARTFSEQVSSDHIALTPCMPSPCSQS